MGLVVCPSSDWCDEDCNAICHEMHYVEMKRIHEPEDCPAVIADLLELY